MKNKKSVGGLEFLRMFMIALAVIIVLAFALSIMAGGLNTSLMQTYTVTDTNAYINATGYTLTTSTSTAFSSPSISSIVNATNGAVISVANATVSSVGVITNASVLNWANVNVTYTYVKAMDTGAYGIVGNFSNGLATLGSNVSTWITLASLVVIVGIIAVVIYLVSRFGGQSEMG